MWLGLAQQYANAIEDSIVNKRIDPQSAIEVGFKSLVSLVEFINNQIVLRVVFNKNSRGVLQAIKG